MALTAADLKWIGMHRKTYKKIRRGEIHSACQFVRSSNGNLPANCNNYTIFYGYLGD